MRRYCLVWVLVILLMVMSSDATAVKIEIENGTCYDNNGTQYCAEQCALPEEYLCIPSNVTVMCQSPDLNPNTTYVGEVVECYDLYARTLKSAEGYLRDYEYTQKELNVCTGNLNNCTADLDKAQISLDRLKTNPDYTNCKTQLDACHINLNELNDDYGSCLNDQKKNTQNMTAMITASESDITYNRGMFFVFGLVAFFGYTKWKNRSKSPDMRDSPMSGHRMPPNHQYPASGNGYPQQPEVSPMNMQTANRQPIPNYRPTPPPQPVNVEPQPQPVQMPTPPPYPENNISADEVRGLLNKLNTSKPTTGEGMSAESLNQLSKLKLSDETNTTLTQSPPPIASVLDKTPPPQSGQIVGDDVMANLGLDQNALRGDGNNGRT